MVGCHAAGYTTSSTLHVARALLCCYAIPYRAHTIKRHYKQPTSVKPFLVDSRSFLSWNENAGGWVPQQLLGRLLCVIDRRGGPLSGFNYMSHRPTATRRLHNDRLQDLTTVASRFTRSRKLRTIQHRDGAHPWRVGQDHTCPHVENREIAKTATP